MVRSSSIIGGSKVVIYLIQLIRIKFVAVLLGPTGVGLISLFQSALQLLKTVSGLGVNQSGVRDISQAVGSEKKGAVDRTIAVLRRACWLTGIIGFLLSVGISLPLSRWLFSSDDYALSICLMGVAVFLGSVSAGQMAVLQGMRRLKELALVNILSAGIGTITACLLYYYFKERGIVPAIVSIAAVNLVFSWIAVRKVSIQLVKLSWPEFWVSSKTLLTLGATFMWGALLAAVVTLTLKGEISHGLGLESAGLYQAAWGLSGLFATFVIQAMSTDFFPRLTGVISNPAAANRMVSEQIEIGILFALPGLLGTVALAPFIVTILYTKEFIDCVELLTWLSGGVLLRVIGWPVGMIPRAKGAVKILLFTMTWGHCANLALSLIFMHYYGLKGIGIGFVVSQVIQLGIALIVGRYLTRFCYSREVFHLIALAAVSFLIGLLLTFFVVGFLAAVLGGAFTFVIGLLCLRGLAIRLDVSHPVVKKLKRVPILQKITN